MWQRKLLLDYFILNQGVLFWCNILSKCPQIHDKFIADFYQLLLITLWERKILWMKIMSFVNVIQFTSHF